MKLKDDIELELIKEMLERGKQFRFRAFGASMFPMIRSGDILTIKPVEIAKLNIGDVIFYNKDQPIAHRLIRKYKKDGSFIFITRGDFMPKSDPPIKAYNILGQVVRVERGNRVIILNSRFMSKLNYLIILIHPLLYPIMRISLKSVVFLLRSIRNNKIK